MALRPEIALQVLNQRRPLQGLQAGINQGMQVAKLMQEQQARRDKAAQADQARRLAGTQSAYRSFMTLPPEQRTRQKASEIVGSVEQFQNVDIDESFLDQFFDPETGIADNEALTALGGALGVNTPQKVDTLTKEELISAGFPEDSVVQRDSSGALKVIQEGTTPVKALKKELEVEGKVFDRASKLRSEVDKVTKTFRDVEDSYTRVVASQEGEITGASDVALIFNYMKMLDPASVVREGEFATAENTTGIPGRILNSYNKLLEGERLNTKQRSNFIAEAKKQYKSALRVNKKREDEYLNLADDLDIPRNLVVIRRDLEVPELPNTLPEQQNTQQPTGAQARKQRREQQPVQQSQNRLEELRAKYGIK